MTSSVTYILQTSNSTNSIQILSDEIYYPLVSESLEKASVIYISFSVSSGTEFVVMRRSLLTQKGKNIFCKSTALQSTDR